MLGFALTAAAAIIAPYAVAPLLGTTAAGLGAVGYSLASSLGSGLAQLGIGLEQGIDLKNALISAGMAAGTTFLTAGAANILSNISADSFGSFGQALNKFGNNLKSVFTPVAKEFSTSNLISSTLYQTAVKTGSEQIQTHLGKTLGTFGTAALLSLAAGTLGSAFAQSSTAPLNFDPSYNNFGSIALRASTQGLIAEAFKNEDGLPAQLFQDLSSSFTAGLSTDVLEDGFRGIGEGVVNIGKLFDPTTDYGSENIRTVLRNNSLFDIKDLKIDKTKRAYFLKEGANPKFNSEGQFLYSTKQGSLQSNLEIYNRLGEKIGETPKTATPWFLGNELKGSSEIIQFLGEPLMLNYSKEGVFIDSFPQIDRGDGYSVFGGLKIDYLGEKPEPGLISKFLTKQDPQAIARFNDFFPGDKVEIYYPPDGEVFEGNNTFFGRVKALEFTDLIGGTQKYTELISQFIIASKAGLTDIATTNDPNFKVPGYAGLAIDSQQFLSNLAVAIDKTIALNSYKIIVSTKPFGNDPVVTVYKPINTLINPIESNSRIGKDFINSRGIKYVPLSIEKTKEFLKTRFNRAVN